MRLGLDKANREIKLLYSNNPTGCKSTIPVTTVVPTTFPTVVLDTTNQTEDVSTIETSETMLFSVHQGIAVLKAQIASCIRNNMILHLPVPDMNFVDTWTTGMTVPKMPDT